MARLVLATLGTWGDLFPMVGLARGLKAAGHDPIIAAPPPHRLLVETEGIAFAGIGPSLGTAEYGAEPRILDGGLGGFTGFLHLFRTFIFPHLEQYVEDLSVAAKAAELLLAHPALLAAPIAAELAGLDWGTLSVFPGLVPTAESAPIPTRVPSPPGALGRAANRFGWWAARRNIARHFDPPVNAVRAGLGLPPVRDSFFVPVDSGRPYLVLGSPAVVGRPADWQPQVKVLGVVGWDRPVFLGQPEGLEEFLSSGEPPVLVTLGASSSLNPESFYDRAAQAVRELGHRTVVLTGDIPAGTPLPEGPDCFVVPFAPVSQVAPRCRAALHHGGVGTTLAIIRAGRPHLVVPRGFDQPQTALRVRRLGVGRSLRWAKATRRRLQQELRFVLSEARYSDRAIALAAQVDQEDGLDAAVHLIEEMVGSAA